MVKFVAHILFLWDCTVLENQTLRQFESEVIDILYVIFRKTIFFYYFFYILVFPRELIDHFSSIIVWWLYMLEAFLKPLLYARHYEIASQYIWVNP